MATVNSVGYANDIATPPVKHDPSEGGGRVRHYYDTYVQGASAGTIGDVIRFKDLPGEARILPGSKAFWGTGTTNETLRFGTTDDDDKFLADTAAAVAGSALLELAHASGGTYKTPAGGVGLIATNATAAIAANQRVTVHILYVID